MMTVEQLYKTKYAYVLRVTQKWLWNEETAKEVTQQFFVWIIEHLNEFDPIRGTFSKWFNAHLVFHIRHHKTYNKHRMNEIYTEDFDAYLRDPRENPIDRAINRAHLIHYIDKLPRRQRELCMMKLDYDMKPGEIVAQEGISHRAVWLNFNKAYPFLRKALSR